MQEERRSQIPKYPMLTDTPHNQQQDRKDFHPPEVYKIKPNKEKICVYNVYLIKKLNF